MPRDRAATMVSPADSAAAPYDFDLPDAPAPAPEAARPAPKPVRAPEPPKPAAKAAPKPARAIALRPVDEPRLRLAGGTISRVNLVVDLAVLLFAVLAARAWEGGRAGLASWDALWFWLGATAVWIVGATALEHYDPIAEGRRPMNDAEVVTILAMAVTTLLAAVDLAAGAGVPRVSHFLVTFLPLVLALRMLVFRPLSSAEGPIDEVIVIGTDAMGRMTGEDVEKKARRRVLGYLFFPDEKRPTVLRPPFLGTSVDLESILRTTPVSEVYVAGDTLKHASAMQAAIRVCEKFGIPFAVPASPFRFDRARPMARQATSDGYLHYVTVDAKPYQMALKRLFDIASSAAALFFLTPLFLGVAAAIKLGSKGPIFFKQVRAGIHGKPFYMMKFRSMVVNAEELKAKLEKMNEQSGPVFKMRNDPRVTGIGRFIRKYSIDELPQLLNVLRGDMSIVGPRPCLPGEAAKYEPWQVRRLSVRPGLTCIWQVSGRNQISFEQWMYLDMQYIDHWSLIQDFNLIFKTVPVVLTGRGAS